MSTAVTITKRAHTEAGSTWLGCKKAHRHTHARHKRERERYIPEVGGGQVGFHIFDVLCLLGATSHASPLQCLDLRLVAVRNVGHTLMAKRNRPLGGVQL